MPADPLALLAAALDAASASAAVFDPEGAVRFISRPARKLLELGESSPGLAELAERAKARGISAEQKSLPSGWSMLALSDRPRREQVLLTALHDLRSPLGNVRSYAGLLLRGRGVADRLQRMADVIARNTERALRLVSLYLDSELLRTTEAPIALHTQPTPVAPLIESALAGRRPLAQERDVRIDVGPLGDATLTCDPERLAAAIEVCLDRAIARTRDGGSVQLRVDDGPAAYVVEVRDAGGPVAADELTADRDARILADRRLYPAIAFHVCEAALAALGGALEVLSEGPGALWRVRLPRR